jgi:hypothetical protein
MYSTLDEEKSIVQGKRIEKIKNHYYINACNAGCAIKVSDAL